MIDSGIFSHRDPHPSQAQYKRNDFVSHVGVTARDFKNALKLIEASCEDLLLQIKQKNKTETTSRTSLKRGVRDQEMEEDMELEESRRKRSRTNAEPLNSSVNALASKFKEGEVKSKEEEDYTEKEEENEIRKGKETTDTGTSKKVAFGEDRQATFVKENPASDVGGSGPGTPKGPKTPKGILKPATPLAKKKADLKSYKAAAAKKTTRNTGHHAMVRLSSSSPICIKALIPPSYTDYQHHVPE